MWRLTFLLFIAISSFAFGQAPPSKSNVEIAASVSLATVSLRSRQADGSELAGSGFVVDASGTLATNLHVVENATFIEVRTATDDVYPVIGVRAVDRLRDIALVQIGARGLTTVGLGDSNLVQPGARVVVIGTALGVLENSVTAGVISGVRDAGGYRLIQMDAAISQGNSGGPVSNERGEVIGIATLKLLKGESLNFAVPINYLKGLLQLPISRGLAELTIRDRDDHSSGNEETGSQRASSTTEALPPIWRSLSTGNIKRLTVQQDRIYIENGVPESLRAAGALSFVELKRVGNEWIGIHRERVNCRPRPFARRRLCPLIEMNIRITELSSSKIEGSGEEPLNTAPFNCSRCEFEDRRQRPFTWVPE